MRATKFHFSKDIIDAKPNRWYLRDAVFSSEHRPFTFVDLHNSAAKELRDKGLPANIAPYDDHWVVYVQFDNGADEAFFLLKYSDGIELHFMDMYA